MDKKRSARKKGAVTRPPSSRPVSQSRPARNPLVMYAGVAVLVLLLLAGGIALASQQNNRPEPGQAVAVQGRDHIQVGAPHPPYNSDPPTSGWHYDTPLPTGFYDTPQVDEYLVHNLEHGHIVISYDCSRLADCDTVRRQLEGIYRRFNAWKVTIVPRQNADAAIALTAWGRIDKMDQFDEARIIPFVEAWRNRGPEKTAE